MKMLEPPSTRILRTWKKRAYWLLQRNVSEKRDRHTNSFWGEWMEKVYARFPRLADNDP